MEEEAKKSNEEDEDEQVEFLNEEESMAFSPHKSFTPIIEQDHEETVEDQEPIEDVINLLFKNEGRYTGTVLKGSQLRHGYGVLRFLDGGRYEGNWSCGKAQGYGHFTFSNGDLYQGLFKDDLFEGLGKFTTKQGPTETYDGLWHKGLRDGHGTYETAQFKYTGPFRKD